MSTPDAATVKQFVQCIAASTSSTSFQVCQGLGSIGFARVLAGKPGCACDVALKKRHRQFCWRTAAASWFM